VLIAVAVVYEFVNVIFMVNKVLCVLIICVNLCKTCSLCY